MTGANLSNSRKELHDRQKLENKLQYMHVHELTILKLYQNFSI